MVEEIDEIIHKENILPQGKKKKIYDLKSK
jgi:hypothetical protein